ncbi:MAG TPA: excalibur calcium-binding domain-containing protein [Sporichthyaceae bacterium]|jgi:hypothetical protein
MYTGPGRLTRVWRKLRAIPPAVQGTAVLLVVVLVAFGAAHARNGSANPNEFTTPATTAPASTLDATPTAQPSMTPDQTPSPTASAPSDEATDEPTGEPTSTESPTLTPTATSSATPTATPFMFADCHAIKSAGRDPLSRGEYGYNPALDKDHDGVDCH